MQITFWFLTVDDMKELKVVWQICNGKFKYLQRNSVSRRSRVILVNSMGGVYRIGKTFCIKPLKYQGLPDQSAAYPPVCFLRPASCLSTCPPVIWPYQSANLLIYIISLSVSLPVSACYLYNLSAEVRSKALKLQSVSDFGLFGSPLELV
jgi:hypothetical protein